MDTAVYVVYATRRLDLDWIPAEAAVVVVHNDDALDRDGVRAGVIHVQAPGNVGFGAGVNLALPHLQDGRVVLCNPDLVLTPEHWRALTAGVGDDEVVTVPLRDADGAPTSVCSRYPTPRSHLASGYRVGRLLPRGSRGRAALARTLGRWGAAHEESLTDPAGRWPLRERWISGAALSLSSSELRAVGGFDESYFLYYEDVDLCRRLAARDPSLQAVVADVTPGGHAVGASADGANRAVERARLESAIRYAAAQPGRAWSLCAAALRARRRFLR